MKRRDFLQSIVAIPFVGVLVPKAVSTFEVDKEMIINGIDKKILELNDRFGIKRSGIVFSKKAWTVMYGKPKPITIKRYIVFSPVSRTPIYDIPKSEYRGSPTRMDCSGSLKEYMICVYPYKLPTMKEVNRLQREWTSIVELIRT